jgi:hypothetical protein
MAGIGLRGLLAALAACIFTAPAHAALSVLDNGTVRVGVDLDQGGRISLLSSERGGGGANLLLSAEQSYWSGPLVAGLPTWHAFQDPAQVVAHANDGRTLYVRAFGAACECTLESWITLHGNAAVVRNRLTSFRSDTTPYVPAWQELPALYTAGAPYRVVTYDGGAPFTHGPVRDASADANFAFDSSLHDDLDATEHWAALVDRFGVGVGLVEPGLTHFAAISGAAGGSPSGYLAGVRREQLDANAVYEYTYSLVVGTVGQIRSYAYRQRPDDRPTFLFRRDREHFTEANATDNGFPIQGALRVDLDRPQAELVGPEQEWPARRVPHLYIRGAWHSAQTTAQLSWTNSAGLSSSKQFRVIPNAFFTYRIDPGWTGTITGIRLAPVLAGERGAWVDLTCISWKPCPIDRQAEGRLLSDDGLVPFFDPFDSLNKTFWSIAGNSVAAAAAVTNNELEVAMPPNAAPLPGQDGVSAGVYSRCTIGGDFDTQVDYRLLAWPPLNGVHVSFSVGNLTVFRSNDGGLDGLAAYFPPIGGGIVADARMSGTLRITRSGALVNGYYRGATGAWVKLNSRGGSTGPMNVGLSLWTTRSVVGAQEVRVAFDNFRVTRGQIRCQ